MMIKKHVLLTLAGMLLFATSCTRDTAVTLPTNPDTVNPKPDPKPDPNPDTDYVGNPGNYSIPVDYNIYYKNIDFRKSGMELKKQLATLITKTHKTLTYSPGVWTASQATDEDPENPNNVLQIYGWPDSDAKENKHKRSIAKSKMNNSSGGSRDQLWEREHVFAKSLAVDKALKQVALETSYAAVIPQTIEVIAGHDAHHLRAINGSWNATRNNRKFVDGKGNSVSKGTEYWYPGDEWKGDVARMMMYMHIRYEANHEYTKATKVGMPIDSKNGILPDEMIDLFLKWNAEDPISEIEIRRNKYHGDTKNPNGQGNRNPFIDNPYLATQIWGGMAAENKWKK